MATTHDQSVSTWLESLGLGRYLTNFEQNEVDWDTLSQITEEDLIQMKIEAVGPRRKLLSAIGQLRSEDEKQTAGVDSVFLEYVRTVVIGIVQMATTHDQSVSTWLESLGLGRYLTNFEQNEVDWDTLSQITEEDLIQMKIEAVGPRRKLLSAIGQLRSEDEKQTAASDLVSRLPESIVASQWLLSAADVRLGAEIGRGFYGVVYRGSWQSHNVAVKRLHSHHLCDPHNMDSFMREVHILSSLRSPYVVLFLGVVVSASDVLLVTEYMPRGSLHDVLQKHHSAPEFTTQRRLEMLRDVAHGLHHLHCRRPPIAHRDLSSYNVLVDSSWRCKVCDFGVSRPLQDAMTHHPGHLRWMAPEVTLDQPYDVQVDVFGFALLLWEMFSGEVPFVSLEPSQAAAKMAYEQARPPLSAVSNMPLELQELMTACWSQEPSERPRTDEVVMRLDALVRKATGSDSDSSLRFSGEYVPMQATPSVPIDVPRSLTPPPPPPSAGLVTMSGFVQSSGPAIRPSSSAPTTDLIPGYGRLKTGAAASPLTDMELLQMQLRELSLMHRQTQLQQQQPSTYPVPTVPLVPTVPIFPQPLAIPPFPTLFPTTTASSFSSDEHSSASPIAVPADMLMFVGESPRRSRKPHSAPSMLATQLHQHLKQSHVDKKALAIVLGVTRQTVTLWLRGKLPPEEISELVDQYLKSETQQQQAVTLSAQMTAKKRKHSRRSQSFGGSRSEADMLLARPSAHESTHKQQAPASVSVSPRGKAHGVHPSIRPRGKSMGAVASSDQEDEQASTPLSPIVAVTYNSTDSPPVEQTPSPALITSGIEYMPDMIPQRTIICAFIGDSSADKTQVLYAVGGQQSFSRLPANVEYMMTARLCGQVISLKLRDTSGHRGAVADAQVAEALASADVIAVCFSIAVRSSFVSVAERWIPEVKKRFESTPRLLIGTEVERRETVLDAVTAWQGQHMAQEFGAEYVECSARLGTNIAQLAEAVVRATVPASQLADRRGCAVM
eukprot:TRINITY_DN10720_c0_g1_i1.p1 TRINITY_DN10720_c0_g1~~TRINITY_DN10720_c0_g1_i1.p1  ORF type:complete len:1003 (+),score=200.49 TRINITY_DN10720_c0_g1_i1:144-3152(+)